MINGDCTRLSSEQMRFDRPFQFQALRTVVGTVWSDPLEHTVETTTSHREAFSGTDHPSLLHNAHTELNID